MYPATQLRRAISALAALFLSTAAANAQPLFMNDPNPFAFPIFRDAMREPVAREPMLREAVPHANRAGSIVVGKFGTAGVTFDELFARTTA